MIRVSRMAPLVALALGAACQDSGLISPETEAPAQETARFSEALSLPELQQSASSAAVRVEVKLRSAEAPLVAREVERADSAAVSENEKIESRVTAADEQGVTLALGGLRVGFDAGTRFRSEGGDTLTRAEFLAQLQAALTAGRQPAVEAERAAAAQPQAPEDAAFVASELEIDDEASEPKLEINIDADNLQLATAPATGATLRVLGLSIEIRGSETEVESRRKGDKKRSRFEGIVASADAAAGTVTLRDGRVIRVVQGTEVETGRAKLSSIAEVAAAVAAGKLVEAEGKGILEGPKTLVAVEVEFEVEEEADDVPHTARLRDVVASVDVANKTFTLSGGQVVRVVEGTRIKGKAVTTLQQLADAVAAQRTIRADGKLLLESAGPPALYVALEIHFKDKQENDEREHAPGLSKIHGRVAAVDLQAGTLTLANRDLIRIAATTAIDADGDLTTLQAVSEAMTAGKQVRVEGKGTLESAGPPRIMVASHLKLEVNGADDEEGTDQVEFESTVASVDTVGKQFTLKDGTVVRLAENASIKGDLKTLQAVAHALSGGRTVTVEGKGTLESAGPPRILVASKVEFESDEEHADEVKFESVVAAVDVAGKSFTLSSGQVVRLAENASISGNLRTLQAVLDALTAGRSVTAEGKGRLESAGPPQVLVAARVKFATKKD